MNSNTRPGISIDEDIERLIDEYGNDVLRIAYMFLKDKDKAEDAFQEVFLKVYKKYGSFKGESTEKTWIIKIAMNVCKDMIKSSWFKRIVFFQEDHEAECKEDFEELVISKLENEELFNKILSLPPIFKEVVILYYYQGFTTPEISKILKISEGTIRSRLHRSRELLRKSLEERGDKCG